MLPLRRTCLIAAAEALLAALPPAKNDEAASAAVTGIDQTGLANLKAVVEKR